MFGRRRLPRTLRPALVRDERVVAWASTSDGRAIVLTNLGLWLPGRTERLSWHHIHRAAWSDPVLTVVPAAEVGSGEGYVVMADEPSVTISLDDPDDVPVEVRSRVSRSVAATTHHDLPEGGVRVVARRVPGRNGIVWHVRFDDGTEPFPVDLEALAPSA
jgi:hypothetical protein